jgi:hypothetical protein
LGPDGKPSHPGRSITLLDRPDWPNLTALIWTLIDAGYSAEEICDAAQMIEREKEHEQTVIFPALLLEEEPDEE